LIFSTPCPLLLKTDGCERIKRDYNKKKSERYWDDEIYHQRSAKKSRIMEEIKNVAETYKICDFINIYFNKIHGHQYNTQFMT
jgi:hypothetical protein